MSRAASQADHHRDAAAGRVVDRDARRPSPRRTRARRRDRARRRVPFELSPRRWNGWNTVSRSVGRDARAAVDDAQVDALLRRRTPRRARAASAGDHASALSTMLAIARSSSAGVGLHARQRLGDVDVDARRASRQPGERAPARTSSSADVAHHELQRAGLQPAHVEQVADEVVEPVGRLVDGLEELAASPSGVQVDVALQQARDRRLDRRQRRAQVVGHRREQRGAQLVRLREPVGARGVGAQRALLRPRSPPGRRTPGAPRGRRVRASRPRSDEHARRRAAGRRRRRRPGRRRDRLAGRRLRRPSRPSALRDSTATASASNAACSCATSCGSGSSRADERAAERGERLRLGRAPAPPRRCGATRWRRARSRRPPTTRKITSASRFSPSAIVNAWNGGVKNQLASRNPAIARDERRARSRRARRPRPRRAGTAAGRSAASSASRSVGQHQREQRRRRRPRASTPTIRRRGDSDGAPAPRAVDADARRARRRRARRRRDHVDVDRRPTRRSTLVDHRAAEQLRPPRLAAGAEHDLGGVLGPGELHERVGDVGAGDLVVLAAELVRGAARCSSSASADGAARARRPDGRGRRAARRGRAAPCARRGGSRRRRRARR